jgi:trk system potassium uptake protein TrkA
MADMKFAVIGLGQFGMAIAKTLANRGMEVLAIDRDEQIVEQIADSVANAVALDSTDRKALLSVDIQSFDAVVVAIGEDFEQLLLTTTQLMDLGVKRIMARARGHNQQLILKKIGVDEVLSPENEVGANVAEKLMNPSVVSYLDLPDEFCIMEVRCPGGVANRSLQEIDMRKRYQVNLLTIKNPLVNSVSSDGVQQYAIKGIPGGETLLEAGQILVLFGKRENVERFIQINK